MRTRIGTSHGPKHRLRTPILTDRFLEPWNGTTAWGAWASDFYVSITLPNTTPERPMFFGLAIFQYSLIGSTALPYQH